MWLSVSLAYVLNDLFTRTALVGAGLVPVGRSYPQDALLDYSQDPKLGNFILRRDVLCGYVHTTCPEGVPLAIPPTYPEVIT